MQGSTQTTPTTTTTTTPTPTAPERVYEEAGKDNLSLFDNAPRFTNWLYSEVKPFLKGAILEIGAGTGTYSKKIIADFPESRVVLSDIDPVYVQRLNEMFKDNAKVTALGINLDHAVRDQQLHETFDAVIALNVMEHIEDDVAAINNIYDILNPGGVFVVLVPAHKFLYNVMDKSIGHFRRYNKKMMREKIATTKFSIAKMFYFNFTSMFGWFVNGNILKKTVINDSALGAFDKVVPVVRGIEKTILRKKIGISLITVLKKPEETQAQ